MKHQESDGMWPGFVDALTNVVFVMIIVVVLMMLMFMATLMKVVNVERERMLAERVASEAVQEVRALQSQAPASASVAPTPKRQSAEVASSVATVNVSPGSAIKQNNGDVTLEGALAFVVFPNRDSALDDKASAELKAILAAKLDSVRLNGVALRADAVPPYVSEGRRLGYYRIVAIREWLVNQGVPAAKIDLRISDTPSVDGKQGVLMLPREPAANTAQQQQ